MKKIIRHRFPARVERKYNSYIIEENDKILEE